MQFLSDLKLVISNRTRVARSFDFEITRMISDQIALHSVQLPLYILHLSYAGLSYILRLFLVGVLLFKPIMERAFVL